MCNDEKCLKGKTHARECEQLARLGGDFQPDWESSNNVAYAAILPLRAYNLKTDGRAKWDEVNALLRGNTDDIRGGFGQGVLEIMRRIVGEDDEQAIAEAVDMMGIRRTNATAMGGMEAKQGNLLFAVYALMNAHCYSNTFYSLTPDDREEADGAFKMLVHAQVDIAKGEEITTRYVCSFDCLPGRQSKIWMNWKFLCRCRRCSSSDDLGTHFSSLRCRSCKDGYLVPLATGMLNPPWRCEECEDKVGPRHVAERLAKYEMVMKNDFFTNREDLQKYLLREMHPNHFLMCTLLQKRLFIRDHFDHKDEKSLEEMVAIGEKLLNIVTTIDPGYTQRRGRILKVLAKDRMVLARLRKENCVGSEEDFRSAVAVAREECKTMALCFMYA